jgi:putative pyoverdin transport system ATP-binding/permease protein
MKLIRLLFKCAWSMVLWSVVAGLLSGFASAGLIAVINQSLSHSDLPKSTLAWGFVGLCVLLLLSSALSQVLVGRVVQKLVYDLRSRLGQQILQSPLRLIESIGAPRLLAALTEDIGTISVASFSVSTLCVNVSLLLGCGIYLNRLIPNFSGLGVLFLLFGVYSYNTLAKPGWRFLKHSREVSDRLFEHLETLTQGTKELKLHQRRRRAFLQEDLNQSSAILRRYEVAANDWFAIAGSWGLLLFFIPIGLFLFAPSPVVLTSSTLASYALTIIFMIAPLRGIIGALPEIQQANISLKKIESLGISLKGITEEIALIDSADLHPQWQRLQLSGVLHRYPSDRGDLQFSLGPLDLVFHPGEIIFIVGGNGSGKSTLVKLLTGLYTPEDGVIYLDRQPITDTNREWYRQQFSAVFSDFYLFERLLGLDHPELDQNTQHYLTLLQLDHKVTVRDGKFSTTALSQGQRKRLALLTAYLEDRPIYVFDEWASDQDPVFKTVFYHQLLPALKKRGKTVFVISHDDRYFDVGDRVIKLDYGQIVEDTPAPTPSLNR